jgi:hypothetical protein
MASRRWLGRGAALVAGLLLTLAVGCDPGGDVSASPFRNLGKRGDSTLTGSAAR